MHASISLVAAIATTGAAKTVVIAAGYKGFTFFPADTSADVGDILEFQFYFTAHTAVQGDFSTPCQGSRSGFDSGPISSAEVFQVTVQNTDPIWFFCSIPTHCQAGMVGVVNAPPLSTNETIDNYGWNAAKTSLSSSAGKVRGGVVLPASSSSSMSEIPPLSSTPSVSLSTDTTALSFSASVSTFAPASASASASGVYHNTTTKSSSSLASSQSGFPTSSPSPTQTPETTGGGSSLMTSANAFLLSAVFGLGIVAVIL